MFYPYCSQLPFTLRFRRSRSAPDGHISLITDAMRSWKEGTCLTHTHTSRDTPRPLCLSTVQGTLQCSVQGGAVRAQSTAGLLQTSYGQLMPTAREDTGGHTLPTHAHAIRACDPSDTCVCVVISLINNPCRETWPSKEGSRRCVLCRGWGWVVGWRDFGLAASHVGLPASLRRGPHMLRSDFERDLAWAAHHLDRRLDARPLGRL